ncbi:Cryptochrome-1 [Orobanche hederae]
MRNPEQAYLINIPRRLKQIIICHVLILRDAEDSTAERESSSSTIRRERDGGVVPVWSPPANSSYSEQENSFLQRHPQSHQVMNWTQRLSQTG